MSRSSVASRIAAWLIAATCSVVALAADYGLGRPATPEEIAAWDIDVRPDGKGLPPGRGSVQQGEVIYDAKCAACHGTFGESGEYIQLAGGAGTLGSSAPVRTMGSLLPTATTLFDYLYRAMPYNDSKSLSWDETYALTAYVLNLNDILPADAVLDQQSLPLVPMPNRDGFVRFEGLMSVDGKSDVQGTACMSRCEDDVRVLSELPAGFVDTVYGDLTGHFRGLHTMNRLGPPAATAVAAMTPPQLAEQQACMACHTLDRRLVGPGFAEVATRYRGQANALTQLSERIRSGGTGAWGDIPMPPQPQLSDAEVHTLATWILDGAGNSP